MPKTKAQSLIFTIMMVTVMASCMSFFNLLFTPNGISLGSFLTALARNFPVALALQLFIAGPLVRYLFRQVVLPAEARLKAKTDVSTPQIPAQDQE